MFIPNNTPLKSGNSLDKLSNLAMDNGEGSSSNNQGSSSKNEGNSPKNKDSSSDNGEGSSSNNQPNIPFPKSLLGTFSNESLENIRDHMEDTLDSSTNVDELATAQRQINIIDRELTERMIAERMNNEASSSSEEDNTEPANNGEGSSTAPNTTTPVDSLPSGAATQGLRQSTDETLRKEKEQFEEKAKNLVKGTQEYANAAGAAGFRDHILKERAKYNTQILSEDQIEGRTRTAPSKPSYTGKGKGVDRG
jgi:hypothetical protein